MKVDQYFQGQPCWAELASLKIDSSKRFYSQLFGWEIVVLPIPEGTYSMLTIEDDDIGAMYQLPEEMVENGETTQWTIYFAVENLDSSLVDVTGSGGTVIVGPHDVGEAGRMAVIKDPEGARFALWQAKNHIGAKRAAENHTLCWVELACRDTEQAKQFYPHVLGWGTRASNMEGIEYTEWQVGAQDVGGMMAMTEEWGDMPAHWMLYFTVESCDDKAAQVEELGGKVCVPPTDIANVGRFAVINDPDGGFFSIIELRMGV
ncbi:glyoxalase [Shewanella sairae]|uniref:Glyoxalase n=1 Tax=Shewanella sairae TaxID=190310 RepID=A0ABQ4NZ62_9GAMM|nr:VOC family protein [Shewanella sairae]MCL1131025.1 VOC family protein [Shewanella sairae]GIU40180.1 glyoxalase [Shewanella sairae]